MAVDAQNDSPLFSFIQVKNISGYRNHFLQNRRQSCVTFIKTIHHNFLIPTGQDPSQLLASSIPLIGKVGFGGKPSSLSAWLTTQVDVQHLPSLFFMTITLTVALMMLPNTSRFQIRSMIITKTHSYLLTHVKTFLCSLVPF